MGSREELLQRSLIKASSGGLCLRPTRVSCHLWPPVDVVEWTLAQPVAKLIRTAPHIGEQRPPRESGGSWALPAEVDTWLFFLPDRPLFPPWDGARKRRTLERERDITPRGRPSQPVPGKAVVPLPLGQGGTWSDIQNLLSHHSGTGVLLCSSLCDGVLASSWRFLLVDVLGLRHLDGAPGT